MAAKTATAAFDATARTSDRSHGAGCRPSPHLGWGARDARRPTGTEDSQRGSCRVFRTFLWRWQARGGGEERPAALLEPRPQERDRYEIAQDLEVPVPQMGEQLPDVLQFFATFLPFVAEQVIEVPKILLHTTPQRLGDHLRQPQMVERLVHVPTVVSYSSLQQLTAEQIVDIPVPGRAGGGLRGGLQGFAGQSSTASSSHVSAADGAGQGVFRTFPRKKKVRSKVRTRGRNWVRTLIHPR